MSLFGGIELPGRPDLLNVALLDRLPVPQIRSMQRTGMAIDRDYFAQLSSEFGAEMVELQKDIASYIPPDRLHEFSDRATAIEDEFGDATINTNSAVQIRKLLFEILNIGSSRELKTTKGSTAISTGKKQLELIKEDHPVVQKVLEYRENAKLKSTYTDSLPKLARYHPRGEDCPQCGLWHSQESWRIHGEIATTRTDTGRKAHRKPNLSNVPARTVKGARIRQGFIASPGISGLKKRHEERQTRLLSVDFGQIELRDLAHCADAKSMIQVYQEDKDIHLFTACAAFGKDYARYERLINLDKGQLTKAEKADLDHFKQFCRMPSKNLNFMIVYGATVIGLLAQLALSGLMWSEDQGNEFIAKWFNLYPEVQAYMELQAYRARRYGLVWDVFGRIRRIPQVRSCLSWIKSEGLRAGGNMPIQSCSAGQMDIVMGSTQETVQQITDEGTWVAALMTIHDELLFEFEEDYDDYVSELIQDRFVRVMEDQETGEHRFRVPIGCGATVMERWQKD